MFRSMRGGDQYGDVPPDITVIILIGYVTLDVILFNLSNVVNNTHRTPRVAFVIHDWGEEDECCEQHDADKVPLAARTFSIIK